MSGDFRDQIVAFLPRLRRFSYALCGDPTDADDIAQETCVRALSHASEWTPGTRLDSWIYRIAQNLWIDKVRSRKTRGEFVDIDDFNEIQGPDGRSVTEGVLMLAHVARAISALPRDQQLLIALVCIDGLSYKEAAEALDVPIGTIMSRLARARQSIYQVLNPEQSLAKSTKGEKTNVRTLR
mgnify:CR=1 FL=1